jgi:hypothetical protein
MPGTNSTSSTPQRQPEQKLIRAAQNRRSCDSPRRALHDTLLRPRAQHQRRKYRDEKHLHRCHALETEQSEQIFLQHGVHFSVTLMKMSSRSAGTSA